MSHVVVLGAGIIGIATAYFLTKAGHRVTVIERNSNAGLETSYANGGQLSYSYVAPLAGPGVVPKIPPWLLRADSPLRFYPKFDLELAKRGTLLSEERDLVSKTETKLARSASEVPSPP